MSVVPIPIVELNGKKEKNFLRSSDLCVISHPDRNLVTLQCLDTVITVDASKLQAAIQNVNREFSAFGTQ